LDNLKEKVESFFDRIENSYKSNTACYSELENLKARIESLNSKDLKRLITLSKRLDHSIEKVNLD
jgi:predicted nuclease with TOPRIM domain